MSFVLLLKLPPVTNVLSDEPYMHPVTLRSPYRVISGLVISSVLSLAFKVSATPEGDCMVNKLSPEVLLIVVLHPLNSN